MISPTEQNYLKAIFNLVAHKGEASVKELSKLLEIKMPTVNSMVKRLAEKGFVIYESYKPIKLTAIGTKEAALIIRKHRLTEMYLVQKMGFGWQEVHSIAEQIEHIQSDPLFAKMDELLNYPKFDPHGSPIPDLEGKIQPKDYCRLAECKIGQTVTIKAVSPSSEELLEFLNGRNLALGTVITIKSIEEFDKSMVVSYAGRTADMLSYTVCEKLLITYNNE